MSQLTRRVRIDAPAEKAWAVVADFGGVANWAPTITESRSLTDANGGVGARRTCTHVKMGELEEAIVEWDEGRRYSYDVTRGLPMPMKSLNNDRSVESDGDGAVVTLRQNFQTKFGPLGSLGEPHDSADDGKGDDLGARRPEVPHGDRRDIDPGGRSSH